MRSESGMYRIVVSMLRNI